MTSFNAIVSWYVVQIYTPTAANLNHHYYS